jgi:hypothetical protein
MASARTAAVGPVYLLLVDLIDDNLVQRGLELVRALLLGGLLLSAQLLLVRRYN